MTRLISKQKIANMENILGRIDIINLILSIIVAAGIYATIDGTARLGRLSGEYGRKAIHISIGIFAASFPVFLSRTEIFVFHGMFFVGIVVLSLSSDMVRTNSWAQRWKASRFLATMFERYEDVSRWTIGQFLYPLALMLVVLFYDDLLIYSFSVLMLALADGFAAVIGRPFGRYIYYVPGGHKSLIGSATFFLISFTLLCVFLIIETEAGALALVPAVVYATLLTIVEGGIAGGFDNLAIPLLTAVLLNTI